MEISKEYEVALNALIKFHEENPNVYDGSGYWLGARVWQQPAQAMTKVTWKYVYLYNINGLLAKYNRKTKEIV